MLESSHHVQAAHGRHLKIEEYEVRPMPRNLIQCRGAAVRFRDHLDVFE
jgi:hypothetical protein